MIDPITTYRIQFNKQFRFKDFEKVIPYLVKLGVKTIYASPIFEAVPGSNHGYDIVNPNRINPEIGTEKELRAMSALLKKHNMLWLQDIVPNHMAFHPKNERLMDVLEKGPLSHWCRFFDTSFSTNFFSGPLMVPFLGGTLKEVIRGKELKLHYTGEKFCLAYYDQQYPLQPESYEQIISFAGSEASWKKMIEQLRNLEDFEDPNIYAGRWHEWLLQLQSLMKDKNFRKEVQAALKKINADEDRLLAIAQQQHYRLCHWKETEEKINYRRFFTINGLICVNIQDPAVFEEHHALVLQLVKEKIFDGLRIDHVDGLYDPAEYLQHLRQAAGREVYITVEKILGAGETLPTTWPVQGATGYEFLAQMNRLLVNEKNAKAFAKLYRQVAGDKKDLEAQVHEKKRLILQRYMQGEWQNLYNSFVETGAVDEKTIKKIGAENLKHSIGELLIHLPVYRFYDARFPLPEESRRLLRSIFNKIKKERQRLSPALNLLVKTFLKTDDNERLSDFYKRCMQYAGPLMAKGVEDTLMYSYNRFLAHNEVGDHPGDVAAGITVFQRQMQQRQEHNPMALNATATHDTKRGEDARARLQVLSDMPGEWTYWVNRWNRDLKNIIQQKNILPADAYLLYQALMAHLPMNGEADEKFVERLHAYIEKALREAKRRSDWNKPNEEYENAMKTLAQEWIRKNTASSSFKKFFRTVKEQGVRHSLQQVLLKFTCPGVPDLYQGTESWDFSFVDPDNRRPVDYSAREEWLNHLHGLTPSELTKKYANEESFGTKKLFLIKLLIAVRRQQPQLWTEGEYLPLTVTGKLKDRVLCFARRENESVSVVVMPLHTAILSATQKKNTPAIDWKDTAILLPRNFPATWKGIFSEQEISTRKIAVEKILSDWPFEILQNTGEEKRKRSAGILLSITSLPSNFGIGDIGPDSRLFADMLQMAGQSWWQILPVNPVEAGQGYSPYSATSGMAGNPLLISPESLRDNGLLSDSDLKNKLPSGLHVDYSAAEKLKWRLLNKAYKNFQKKSAAEQKAFVDFCRTEKKWLDDFAAYTVIKKTQKENPWYEWPEPLRLRQKGLQKFLSGHAALLQEVRWYQYIFFKQWQQLKAYCNDRKIRIIGDLPFYVSYDSADVWAHRNLFALDAKGNITGVAGVPPDAFSDDGQLWGMPVYNWPAMQKENFRWWKGRLALNLRLFDLVRIDHFRALESYWVVPPGQTTAKNGRWQKAPGRQWLHEMQKHFGKLPFIAEDLGDVDENVFRLRDEFGLPGMKLLQFAFGDTLSSSPHIPHNFVENAVVYTGTHDNNTTRGWFENDIPPSIRQQVAQYTGHKPSAENIAEVFMRLAYSSVAQMAMLPLQDVLSLDHTCRINTPSVANGNWTWRLQPGEFEEKTAEKMFRLTQLFNR
ncbi:MAG: malto-oligosyltrehalose synthase [Flavisolibacter sp.]